MLHLFRRDHFPAPLYEVLGPARQVDVVVLILVTQVTGVDPTGAEGFLGGGLLLPVATHHARTSGHDLAYLSRGDGVAFLVDYLYFHVFQRLAYRGQPADFLIDLFLRPLQHVVFRGQHGDG